MLYQIYRTRNCRLTLVITWSSLYSSCQIYQQYTINHNKTIVDPLWRRHLWSSIVGVIWSQDNPPSCKIQNTNTNTNTDKEFEIQNIKHKMQNTEYKKIYKIHILIPIRFFSFFKIVIWWSSGKCLFSPMDCKWVQILCQM